MADSGKFFSMRFITLSGPGHLLVEKVLIIDCTLRSLCAPEKVLVY
jgi:hypothetical protein